MKSATHTRPLAAPKRIEFPSNFLKPLLTEGFPEGSSISLVGPSGVGKTIFCESLAKSFIQSNIGCLYVTTDRAPMDIKIGLQQLGTDVLKMESKKRLVFVDGYCWLAGDSDEVYSVQNLANLAELSILIERAASHLNGPIFLVLDSVSPLLVYNPEMDVIKFLQLLSARIKHWRGLSIYVVPAGIHSEEFYNTLAYLVDGIFDMKMEEKKGEIKRYFRIRNLRFMSHKMKWLAFTIESARGFRFRKASSRGGA